MIRVVLVDDEPLAHEILQEYLKEHDDIEVVGNYYNGFEGIKGLQETNPDLVFLDIQMPKINGLEMLELLENMPKVIFVTAYDEYAVKAFEVQALDYLLKPFSKDRLAQALDRYRRSDSPLTSAFVVNESLKQVYPEGIRRVVVKTGNKVEVIPLGDIHYLSAEDDYVGVVTAKGKFLKLKPMKYFEEVLDSKLFIRVHRSYMVNVNEITRVEPYEKNKQFLVLRSGERIPVSKQGGVRLKEFFNT